MIAFKTGVDFRNMSQRVIPAVLHYIDACNIVSRQVIPTITAGRDGIHMVSSKHYSGEAVDLRSRAFTPNQKEFVLRYLQFHLGSDYDVVSEHTHIHVEYDPKGV